MLSSDFFDLNLSDKDIAPLADPTILHSVQESLKKKLRESKYRSLQFNVLLTEHAFVYAMVLSKYGRYNYLVSSQIVSK